jgi:hypothetical protein
MTLQKRKQRTRSTAVMEYDSCIYRNIWHTWTWPLMERILPNVSMLQVVINIDGTHEEKRYQYFDMLYASSITACNSHQVIARLREWVFKALWNVIEDVKTIICAWYHNRRVMCVCVGGDNNQCNTGKEKHWKKLCEMIWVWYHFKNDWCILMLWSSWQCP